MTDGEIIVLLGPPGAGKGTQAEKLAQKFGLLHLSTGGVLRDAVKKGTELGKQVQAIMESGELVPDTLVSKIVDEWIRLRRGNKGLILDGFPRNLVQAGFLKELEKDFPVSVINIQVDESEIVKRLAGRRSCPQCGKIYNVYTLPPEQEGVCDRCGACLVQREDDREEVVQERLRVYRTETEPLIDFYSDKSNYYDVDGNQDPRTVFRQICMQMLN